MRKAWPGAGLRVGWFVAGALALAVAGWGLLDFGLYEGLISPDTAPGALSQDAITVFAGAALCVLAVAGRWSGPKHELVALGLLGYLFYGYGIYVIERMYNALYLAYLAIFALAFWCLAIGAVGLVRRAAEGAVLPRPVRLFSAWGSLLQPVVFYPLWIAMLIPLMTRRDQVDSLYSIFILDLCFIMPAFLLLAIGLFRTRGWAVLLAPAMFVLGAALILSLAIGELVKPVFELPITAAALTPPLVLTALFVVLAVVHLRALRLTSESPDGSPVPPDSQLRAPIPT